MRPLFPLLLVLAAPLAGCGGEQQATQIGHAVDGPRLLLAASQAPDWQDVSADITTVDQAQIIARIPGILTTLSVREGDQVRKGQVIGRIVDSQLGQQAAAYRAQATQAQAELSRVQFLHKNGVYADARLEQAQAAAASARAQYAAASAVAGQGALVAPSSGRVLQADIPAGAPVAPGMAVAVITAGPTVLRLEMPESLAAKVHAGSRVRATAPDGQALTGTVTKVYPMVVAGQVRADVALPGISDSLIGRRLPAKVEVGTRQALLVPASFVTTRYGLDYVTVLAKDGSAGEVPVQTAPSSEQGKVEILSGVGVGDTLIAAQPAAK